MSTFLKLIGLISITVLSGASVALGQLSDDDIAALQKRAQAEGWTFTVGRNPATLYSVSQLCGTVQASDAEIKAHTEALMTPQDETLPSSWDWRTKVSGGMPPVRNQGGCGSCWAFGSAAALECNIKIKDLINVDLSEQWLVSCNRSGWSCGGGWFAHDYHLINGAQDSCGGNGAVLDSDFPYTATDAPCECPYPHHYWINSWAYINTDVNTIKQAIIDYGPVSVTVHGGDSPFQAYRSGVYGGTACYTGGGIDHLVALVGWDDNQGAAGVWLLRNSWGSGWGEGGYMRIEYGCNNVAQTAAYVNYVGGSTLTERVSVATGGAQGNGGSGAYPLPSVSGDGRFVAFDSAATNLVAGDTNAKWDVFVRDRQAGATERLSLTSGGGQATGGDSQAPVISPDGRYVAFYSTATNLVSGDTNGKADVFLRDRQTGATELISVTPAGAPGNGNSGKSSLVATPCGGIALSADGRYVAFVSSATNLVSGDTNNVDDIFVRDRQAGTTQRVSVDASGAQANGHSLYVAMSADGRYVAFCSQAGNLVSGDTGNYADIFVHDCLIGATERVSVADDGSQANNKSGLLCVSSDGRFVAFESTATNLVSGGTTHQQIFLRDRQAATTELVSLRSAGSQGNNDSYLPSISADGSYVAFGSIATNLIASDTNSGQDIFLRDRTIGTTSRVSVTTNWSQSSSNKANSGACISGGGRCVAFASSATNLVSGDTNGAQDIFLHDCGTGQGLVPAANPASVSVPEGGNATFQLKLNRQPLTNVIVSVAPDSAGPISVQSGASLTFTPDTWNTYQTVTLAADADTDSCNDQVAVRCAIVGGGITDVIATQQDIEIVTILTDSTAVSVPENGTAALQVKLNREPCGELTVAVARAGGSDHVCVQSGASLTFNGTNWNTYQTATLASIKDVDGRADQATIRCSAVGLADTDVTATQQELCAGDFDDDGDVDLQDFSHLQLCLTGHGIAMTDPACNDADLDGNGWIDQTDMGLFVRSFNGTNRPPKVPG